MTEQLILELCFGVPLELQIWIYGRMEHMMRQIICYNFCFLTEYTKSLTLGQIVWKSLEGHEIFQGGEVADKRD